LVCDPRKTPLLKVGNHNDREDARKLSELLYLNRLSPVFHGETFSGILRGPHCQRYEASDGAADPGAQDRGHHFARLEERSLFRR
jgi:hypothetical protein